MGWEPDVDDIDLMIEARELARAERWAARRAAMQDEFPPPPAERPIQRPTAIACDRCGRPFVPDFERAGRSRCDTCHSPSV